MEKVLAALDLLNDIPNISEKSVFDAVVEANNSDAAKLSAYTLADMWNRSDAVKFCFAERRTAADFMSKEKQ